MNAGVVLWARREWRRRWVALGLLALLIAVGGGATVASAAAARRTDTAFDRLLHETRTPNLSVSTLTDGGFADLDAAALDRVEQIDGVRGATSVAFMGIAPEEYPNYFAVAFIAARGDSIWSVWVEGGVDDLESWNADEVVINEAMRDRLGKSVGDHIRLLSLSPDQIEASFLGQSDVGAPAGPVVDVRIVAVGRGVDDVTDRPDPFILLPPSFYATYHDTIGNCRCILLINADPALVDPVATHLAALFPTASVEHAEDYAARISDTVSLQRRGWWLIALTAATASMAAVYQTCARLERSLRAIDDAQLVLGTTRRECKLGRFLVVVPAAVVGSVGAAAVAYSLSFVAPVGLTSRAEPDPGLRWDATTILPGVALLAVVSVAVVGLTTVTVRRRAQQLAPRMLIGRPVASFGGRLALGPGRQAVVGVFVATAGLVGALTFEASVDHLLETPALYGADFDAGVFIDDVGDRRATAEGLGTDQDIEAVALWWSPAGGQTTPVTVASSSGRIGVEPLAYESVKGTIASLTSRGRAPAQRDEVAIGGDVMAAIGVDVGDRISATGARGSVELTIVGEALEPGIDVSGGGFAMTPDGLAALVQPAILAVVVRAASTADLEVILARHADQFLQPMEPPSEVGNIGQLGGLPDRVAQLLVLLGLAVVLNATVATVRAGRTELAIHRALGFTRRQVIDVYLLQGAATALAGAVSGGFVGFVAGRGIHRQLVLDVGVIARTVVPPQMWFVVAGVLLVSVAAGGIGGVLAARLRPRVALRAE